MLKEIDRVLNMNSLAFVFSECFFPWCFDVTFEFYNSVLIQMLISYKLYKIAE